MASSADKLEKLFRRWPLMRVAFDASISGESPQTRDEARKLLAKCEPNELLEVVFAPKWEMVRLGGFWQYLEKTCQTRWQLFHWVYADDTKKLKQVYKDRSWQTLRIESGSLYAVVGELLKEARSRHPWLKRRHLFGYAYGQPKPARNGGRDVGSYTRHSIVTGNGKRRTLYVPRKALARVQKALLRHVLNTAQEGLPDCVMGGRANPIDAPPQYGIFHNASAHLGQNYLVSFDIRDFFPSIRTDDIITALTSIKEPAIVDSSGRPHPWTHDLVTFVAKLVTFRGRLPQGAPTSPAIANLVFRQYDRRILDRLGEQFVYTRYFDDLTISVAERDATARGLRTPAAVREHVEKILVDVLSKSRFQLNARKTRARHLSKGAFVTGLHVTEATVAVPRKTRRSVRALLHRIRSRRIGFVEAATSWYRNADFLRTKLNAHRGTHRRPPRRLTMEKMAVTAIRDLCGTIRIELPESASNDRGVRVYQPPELREGKAALRDVAYLLSKLWQQQLRADSDDGHVTFRDAAGVVVARLRCDKNDGLFLLDKKDAFACIELWHHLTGMWSGFNPHSPDRCFQSVRNFRDQIRETLDRVHIGRPDAVPLPPTPPASGERITIASGPAADVGRLAPQLLQITGQWQQLVGQADVENADVTDVVGTFCHPVDSLESFTDWLAAFRKVITARCVKLPVVSKHGVGLDRLLVVFHDRVRGERHAFYECEKKLVSDAARVANNHIQYAGDITKIPLDVLKCLQAEFVKIYHDAILTSVEKKQRQGSAALQADLQNAQLSGVTAARIKSVVDRLMTVVKDARWKTTLGPVFLERGRESLANNIHDALKRPSAGHEWSQVLGFGKTLFGDLLEHMEGDCKTLSPKLRTMACGDDANMSDADDAVAREGGDHWALRKELMLQLGLRASSIQRTENLRHRAAHANGNNAVNEWWQIIKYAKAKLGRRLLIKLGDLKSRVASNGQNTDYLSVVNFDDLSLSALEAHEVIVGHCEDFVEAISILCPGAPP